MTFELTQCNAKDLRQYRDRETQFISMGAKVEQFRSRKWACRLTSSIHFLLRSLRSFPAACPETKRAFPETVRCRRTIDHRQGAGWTGKRSHMSSSRAASILSAHAGITSSLPLHQTWRRPWRAWGRGSVYREARRVFRKNPAVNWFRSLGLNRPSTPGSSSCLPVYRHWTALWVSRFHLHNPAQGLKLTSSTTATVDHAEGNKTLLWADSCCPWARARDVK